MIADILSDGYQKISEQFHFRPWQAGLLAEMVSTRISGVKIISMGRGAGHTYFAQVTALSEFPLPTKVFALDLRDYAHIVFKPEQCHEPIGSINNNIQVEIGCAQAVVLDFAGELISSYDEFMSALPKHNMVLVLDANFS